MPLLTAWLKEDALQSPAERTMPLPCSTCFCLLSSYVWSTA
jgi:hypothetical protein